MHPLAPLSHIAPVRCANFVSLPMHRQRALSRLHDAIHPDVANAARWVSRNHHWHRDVGATILRPALHQRERVEIDVGALEHRVLTRRLPATHARWKLADLEEP